jgi:hypothetical protein
MRKQNNNAVQRVKCYREKDVKNGWLVRKKDFDLASLVVGTSLLCGVVDLAQCAPPQRGTWCKDWVVEGGVRKRGRVSTL